MRKLQAMLKNTPTKIRRCTIFYRTLLLCLMLGIAGCSTAPPSDIDNICTMFREKPSWYRAAQKSAKKWGVPEPVLMAFKRQESSFKADARPERTKILWIIPWKRPSTAYGYSQALDPTWKRYIESTGNKGAKRTNFADSADFVGWYNDLSHRELGIAKTDARNLYLAYHEGQGGYRRKTYRNKAWLITVADRVGKRAATYTKQLDGCRSSLSSGWRLWPF